MRTGREQSVSSQRHSKDCQISSIRVDLALECGGLTPLFCSSLVSKVFEETAPRSSMAPTKDWPHAPVHRFESSGIYMVTAATLYKNLMFRTPIALSLLENNLLSLAHQYKWQLEAWSGFSNHYHFLARRNHETSPMNEFLSHLHTVSAIELNRLDACAGRNVWYNFWDTKLTFERSYLARLNYVHQNPVKHGLVPVANRYSWCSAAWFERTASPAAIKMIYSFKTDQLRINDDY